MLLQTDAFPCNHKSLRNGSPVQCDQIVSPKNAQNLKKIAQTCQKSPKSFEKTPKQGEKSVFNQQLKSQMALKVTQTAKNRPIWSR